MATKRKKEPVHPKFLLEQNPSLNGRIAIVSDPSELDEIETELLQNSNWWGIDKHKKICTNLVVWKNNKIAEQQKYMLQLHGKDNQFHNVH